MSYVTYAPELWKSLNGIICVYKPTGLTASFVRKILIGNIANDFNELPCRPPVMKVFQDVNSYGEVSKRVAPSFADHELVVGPRYLPNDVRCSYLNYLGKYTSGVFVLSINRGNTKVEYLRASRPVRVFHVSGKLGIATDTYDVHGAVVERSSFRHVNQTIMDRILASMQAAHQRTTFQHVGLNMQSQAAYELAAQGTVRPADGKIPFLYSIKCIQFTPPDFTIEVKCVNEYEAYLKTLVHDIGMQVHATAACSGIRCIRYGPFYLEHALLRRHWHLQSIFNNISTCQKVLRESSRLTRDTPSSLFESDTSKKLLNVM